MLHVYDLSSDPDVVAVNRVLRSALGTGAFHCGVEVYMKEWSFRHTKRGTGVFWELPRRCPGASYCDSLFMGNTLMTESEVLRLVQAMAMDWQGRRYDILKRNCCHFSAALCKYLGVGEAFPDWVLNLASTGNDIVEGIGAVASEVTKCGKCVQGQFETISESAQVQGSILCGSGSCCGSPVVKRAELPTSPQRQWPEPEPERMQHEVLPPHLVSSLTGMEWSERRRTGRRE